MQVHSLAAKRIKCWSQILQSGSPKFGSFRVARSQARPLTMFPHEEVGPKKSVWSKKKAFGNRRKSVWSIAEKAFGRKKSVWQSQKKRLVEKKTKKRLAMKKAKKKQTKSKKKKAFQNFRKSVSRNFGAGLCQKKRCAALRNFEPPCSRPKLQSLKRILALLLRNQSEFNHCFF